MRHPETVGLSPDQQAVYDEWLWLLTRWGTHSVDEAHELALHRAGEQPEGAIDSRTAGTDAAPPASGPGSA